MQEKFYSIDQKNLNSHYTMVIYWSSVDFCFLVALPELRGHVMNWQSVTHGDTYEEAARNGTEAIEVILEDETAPGD